jgi:hypothetical protein
MPSQKLIAYLENGFHAEHEAKKTLSVIGLCCDMPHFWRMRSRQEKIVPWVRITDADGERSACERLRARSSNPVSVHDLVPRGSNASMT